MDAQFGCLHGVLRTRVGYCGGKKQKPTYHDLGDHSETTELDFDPSIISYGELVKLWLAQYHDDRGWSRQYLSLLFHHNEEQRKTALEVCGDKAREAIVPYDKFWLAEDYHQKYYLRHSPVLLKELGKLSDTQLIDSTLAARFNGFAGGYGNDQLLELELASYKLSPEGEKQIRQLSRRKG